jgi:predicted exporter
MTARRARIIAPWLLSIAAALWIVAHARYITDLSAFLPAKPTALQRLLVDQLRDGPASRLILIALEEGDPKARARVSTAMAKLLRSDARFSSVDSGEPFSAERDRDFLFQHRYLLSNAVNAQRFSAAGLRAAIEQTIENLASSTGLMLKSLVPHDPTGEMLQIIDQLGRTQGPRTQDGAWVSADGTRTLMVAQTAASGSDTDAQERAIEAIRSAFSTSMTAAGLGSSAVQLRMSGPGVFAVAARAKIKRAAMRLSIVSGILVIAVLLAVYRSIAALGLGLLPVATGALLGIAAVALGFGSVHGITLGFGITLIGESVDYSIYFFIQSLRRDTETSASESWQRLLWPTVRLGMLTSVCGFVSLLPSGFPGLAQLGLYSISGLIAAALVTRFVLPELLPRGFKIRDVTPLGLRIGRLRDSMRRAGGPAIAGTACAIAAVALLVLYRHHDSLWNRELSALSPVSLDDQRFDAQLRADLGAANVLDVVIAGGPNLEAALRGAERAGATLQTLIDAKTIGAFDSPAIYLPSQATQQARRSALPDKQVLQTNLKLALEGLDLKEDQLSPFVADVEAARHAPLVTVEDLRGTSLAAGFGALILHQSDHWSAFLPLHAADGADTPDIDVTHVAAALAAANLSDTQILDMKTQTDALYTGYLREAIRLSLCGFALIVLLLWFALRSPLRVARVLAPLVLAVLVVAATLAGFGQQLTILHLVGMLLIIAVGSNYALFFDDEGARQRDETSALTLASLGIANISTVIGFGLLAFSQVPVLEALGTTVAPGAFLALLFSAAMTSRAPPAPHGPTARPAAARPPAAPAATLPPAAPAAAPQADTAHA